VAGSLKITSTLFTNKVLRISKLDIYKCPFLKSWRKFPQKRVSVYKENPTVLDFLKFIALYLNKSLEYADVSGAY